MKLFTPLGWTRKYAMQTVQNFEVPRRGDGKNTIITAKVMVTAEVTIHGLGTHTGTGEEWAIDENALTRAEALAFKRACSCFGLGRYFYDLPRSWVDTRICLPDCVPAMSWKRDSSGSVMGPWDGCVWWFSLIRQEGGTPQFSINLIETSPSERKCVSSFTRRRCDVVGRLAAGFALDFNDVVNGYNQLALGRVCQHEALNHELRENYCEFHGGPGTSFRIRLPRIAEATAVTTQSVESPLRLRSFRGSLITDVIMPDVEVLETIRAIREEFPNVPALAISGHFGGQFLTLAQ